MVIRTSYFDKEQVRLHALKEVDVSDFSGPEISIVEQVLEGFRDHDAASVSRLSHMEAGWLAVGDYDEIPYEMIFVASSASSRAIERGLEIAARDGLLVGS